MTMIAISASADDGAIAAVGGAVRALQSHPTIEMTSEYVHAKAGPKRIEVECVFLLRNHGPATRATVGFPCISDGADVNAPTPFKDFHSYVDGEEVDVRVMPDSTKNVHADAGSWWVKEVSFKAGETKCLRETYIAEPGTTVDPASRSFEYLLWTGGSWMGPIGIADIVVTMEGAPARSVAARPAPTSRTDTDLIWHFRSLEPDVSSETARIQLNWAVPVQP